MKKSLVTFIVTIFIMLNTILPAFADSNVTLTVQTDAAQYISGSKIQVSGTVLKGQVAGKGTSPMMQVKNTANNTVVEAYQWNDTGIDEKGNFKTTIKTSKYSNGSYKIQISAINAQTVFATFEITDGKENPVEPTPQPDPGPTVPIDPEPTLNAPEVNVVTSETLEIKGMADKGSKVKITDKKEFTKESIAKTTDGTFSILLDKKLEAGTILYATTNIAEKVSGETKIVVIDKTPPTMPVVHKISDKDQKVTGTTEAYAKVTVKVGNKVLGTGAANKKGQFSIKIKAQKAGIVLTVVAVDKAGNNSTSKKITVVDKIAPKVPSVNTVKTISTKVTGKAEASSKVYVKAGKKVIGSAKVSKKGTFSVNIKRQKANTKLSIFAKDNAGNVGKAKTIIVKK